MATSSTTSLQSQLRFGGSPWKTVAIVLPFLVLFWINIAHHVPFFDEVNAWAISAASPDLKTLFHYVHFEGHPWLWYLILWFPSRLTHDPAGMKWVEAAIGTAIIVLVGTLSPFTYKQRLLILGSYFLVWEYTVMCRMYGLMLLLVLLYVIRRVRRPEGIIGNCVLLGLAGNTDMTGVLLSSALLTEYAYSLYVGTAATERRAAIRRLIPGVVVYVALIGLAVVTLWPSKDISWQSSGHIGSHAFDRHRIDRAFGNMIALPWWPISPKFPHRFWADVSITEAHWLYLLVPIVLFVYWVTFRRDRNLLLMMGCTLAFGILFADVVYEGWVRHWGIVFVSFVVGLWLRNARVWETEHRIATWSPWTYALFGLSAIAAVLAVIGSWHHPFTRAKDAAMWIRENEPLDGVITGTPDVSFGSLAERLGRPTFFLECECVDTFKLFSKNRENFSETEAPARLNRALDVLGRNDVLFTMIHAMGPDDFARIRNAGLSAEPVKEFSGAELSTENYFVYRVSRAGQSSAATH